MNRWLRTLLLTVPPLIVFGLFLLGWHWVVDHFQIHKTILPSPKAVVDAAWENRESLVKGVVATGKAAILGLLSSIVAGTGLAILFSQSKLLRMSSIPMSYFFKLSRSSPSHRS